MTDRVVDYAWTRPASLAPYVGIMRYISHDPSKDLSPAEREWALAQHKTIGLVHETIANRAGQGFNAGAADAGFANTRADALGYPKTATLWYAVDFDGRAAQVQPYFDGIASVGGRIHAPYGGFYVIDGVRYPGVGWQTIAWSGGRVSPRAGLLQDRFSGAYDENKVLRPDYGAWGTAQPAPPVPVLSPLLITQEEQQMRADKRPTKFQGHTVYDVHVTGVGTTAQQKTADGRTVKCVRSILRIDTAEAIDGEIEIVADGKSFGVIGVPATGSEIACPESGRASIVNHVDDKTDLLIDYDVVWA